MSEEKDAGIADDGAGDGGALLLSARKSDAALADYRFILIREAFDVGIEAGACRGFTNLMQIVIRKAKGDVAADCFAEEIGVLRDVADRATQRIERPFANGAAVDEEFAFGSFPEAGDQRGEGSLATAGGADDGEC